MGASATSNPAASCPYRGARLAFVLEVAALVILSVWGFRAGESTATRVFLGVGTPAAAITLWWLYAAPRSRYDLPAAEFAVKVLVLGGAALASFALVPAGWAVAFTSLLTINLLLMYVGPFAR